MTNFWKQILDRLFVRPASSTDGRIAADSLTTSRPTAPLAPPGDTVDDAFPRVYRTTVLDDRAHRPRLFDPALKHYRAAFRPGDPSFDDVVAGRRWVEARRRVTDHVLRRIAESAWGDGLVLRGSRLLKTWLADAAREPGDLDWVVTPPTLGPADPWSRELFDGLVATVLAQPWPDGVELIPNQVAVDDIWTYERAPGRRVVFPWRVAELPGGGVQVDVVFGENPTESDRRRPLPVADGGCVSARAVGPAQSLAWKLLWLATDMHPQGKDLYDAVLLAERFALPRDVLDQTFRRGGADPLPGRPAAFVDQWAVDWNNFRAEYPWVGGSASEWQARLATALGPTFNEYGQSGVDADNPSRPAALDPSWLTSTVVQLATGIDNDRAFDRLPILADALQDAGCTHDGILNHCQNPGPHDRGCLVVDLVLGRE